MAVKREKVHFETVEQLLGAPIEKDATTEVRIDQIFLLRIIPLRSWMMTRWMILFKALKTMEYLHRFCYVRMMKEPMR